MSWKSELKQYYLIISAVLIYFIRGPPRKSWSLKEHITVYILRHSLFVKQDDLVKFREDIDASTHAEVKDSQLEKVKIHSKYRQQAHSTVKTYLKEVYGDDVWYEENSLWSNSKPLEAEWLVPNHLTLSSQSKVIFYIFGGGHVFGNFTSYRAEMENVAKTSNTVVFGSSYRLAPDYSAPCQVEDLLAQILYLTSPIDENNPDGSGCGIDFDQIVVSGDSAGGNLSSALMHLMRDLNIGKFAGAVLYSPWLDVACSQSPVIDCDISDYVPKLYAVTPTKGYTPETGDNGYQMGYYGSTEKIKNAILKRGHIYAPLKHINAPIVSPLCDSNFRDLPPILMITGEAETLRLETFLYHGLINEAYTTDEIKKAKIPPVTSQFYQDMVHTFQMIFPELEASQVCFIRASHFIRQCFSVKSEKFEEIKLDYPINTQLVNNENSDSPISDEWPNIYLDDLNHNLTNFAPKFKTVPRLIWERIR
jgi:acetyl esterase/lipase